MRSSSTAPNNGFPAGDVLQKFKFDSSVVRHDCDTLLQLRSTSTVLSDDKLLYMTRNV